jgi:cholesterol oxidase
MARRESGTEGANRAVEERITTRDGLELILRRHTARGSNVPKHTVLLLHGASAASDTFQIPEGSSLIEYLSPRGCDVWTLDWRGSHRVVANHRSEYGKFTLDAAAAQDFSGALDRIREQVTATKPISVFAHCMGAGTFAMAIGAGWIGAERVEHVVLSTLGLFYRVPWDGWVKAEDEMLERIRGENPEVTSIDSSASQHPWPDVMEQAYARWPATLLPSKRNDTFRRLSFMFGQPYRPDLLSDDIHGEENLRKQFGEIPLSLYIHCSQNVRRGFAAPFDDVPGDAAQYMNVEKFRGLKLTLITGNQNELWHPDAIHLMYDWLRRALGQRDCRMRIFGGYAHQDLLWARAAREDVYPTIAAGLGLS